MAQRITRFDLYCDLADRLGVAEGVRMDTNETAYFARQLESIDKKLYDRRYPEFKGTSIVPIMGGVDEGAEEYTYRSITEYGISDPIANYGDKIKRSDVQGAEETSKIFGHALGYGFTIQDMRRGRMTGQPLDAARALGCRRGIAARNDEVLAIGFATLGIKGFYNNASVELVSPTTGTWSGATADQIAADLHKMENDIINDSKGAEMPDLLVLPPTLFGHANTKLRTNTDTTALQAFLRNSQSVKRCEIWARGADAGAGSVARIAMGRQDPETIEGILPVEFYQMAPQQEGLGFVVNCDSRCGGVVFRYPGAWRYMDGC